MYRSNTHSYINRLYIVLIMWLPCNWSYKQTVSSFGVLTSYENRFVCIYLASARPERHCRKRVTIPMPEARILKTSRCFFLCRDSEADSKQLAGEHLTSEHCKASYKTVDIVYNVSIHLLPPIRLALLSPIT